MINNNNDDNLQLKLITNNVNVSETNDLKEFGIMVFGVIALLFVIFFTVDIGGKIYLSQIDFATQQKIENLYRNNISSNISSADKEKENISNLERIKNLGNKIIQNDDDLANSNLQFHILKEKDINAFVMPSGDIYVTTGLLKEIQDNDEILTFVLAHEIGHYKHKHHLQVISRELAVGLITLALFQDNNLSKFATSVNETFYTQYSKIQENQADKYANDVIVKFYGNNNGGVEFFKLIDEKYNLPEFIHYFSTHPSPKDRINAINKR